MKNIKSSFFFSQNHVRPIKETKGSQDYTSTCIESSLPLTEECSPSFRCLGPTLQARAGAGAGGSYLPVWSCKRHSGVRVALPIHDGEALALEDAVERSGRGGQEREMKGPQACSSRPPWVQEQLSHSSRPRALSHGVEVAVQGWKLPSTD